LAKKHLPRLRDGRECREQLQIRRIEKFLCPYDTWPVVDFGPEEIQAVQEAMVAYRFYWPKRGAKDGDKLVSLGRSSINRMINQVHKMWRWGIGRQITTDAQAQLLKEVQPLRAGRTVARDQPRRRPITEDELEAVVAKLPTIVADMVRLAWLTAMRPSEVCRMRPIDILQDDPDCWLYIPGRDESPVGDHKTTIDGYVRSRSPNKPRIFLDRGSRGSSPRWSFSARPTPYVRCDSGVQLREDGLPRPRSPAASRRQIKFPISDA